MTRKTIEEIERLVELRGAGIEPGAALAAAHQGELWDVDAQNDGHDSLVIATSEDEALEAVAEKNRPNDSAAHSVGRAEWARERRWTAERCLLTSDAIEIPTGHVVI